MVGETDYWPLTLPFIERYCERYGYRFRVFRENCLPLDAHPSWNKLLVPSFVQTPHALVWDADLVPLPDAPPIHPALSPRHLAMVKIEPSRGGRMKLRRCYGREAEPHLWWNCGLISVPHRRKLLMREVFFAADYMQSIFWEQGELNRYCYENDIKVCELDPRWNCWISGTLEESHVRDNYCLHFAKGSSRRMRNIGRLYKMLDGGF